MRMGGQKAWLHSPGEVLNSPTLPTHPTLIPKLLPLTLFSILCPTGFLSESGSFLAQTGLGSFASSQIPMALHIFLSYIPPTYSTHTHTAFITVTYFCSFVLLPGQGSYLCWFPADHLAQDRESINICLENEQICEKGISSRGVDPSSTLSILNPL